MPMVVFVADRNGPLRHLGGAMRTALWLVANRPRSVWFQYSFVLAAVLAAYRTLEPLACRQPGRRRAHQGAEKGRWPRRSGGSSPPSRNGR